MRKRYAATRCGAILTMVMAMVGCASSSPFVWVDDLPPAALAPEAYRVQPQDTISVQVWNQQKLSGDVRVRPDGQVTLPLLGDVAVGNLTPTGAAQQIEHRLEGLVVDPKVTVSVKEGQPASFSVVGEIKASGSYPLHPGMGLLQALATAGGLTEFSNPNKIYVIRKDTGLRRIRFTYGKLAHAEGRGVLFQLRDGDIVVVE
jgi:polysaccharide export outer membrane protein